MRNADPSQEIVKTRERKEKKHKKSAGDGSTSDMEVAMANVVLEVVLAFPVPMAFSVFRVQEEVWVS